MPTASAKPPANDMDIKKNITVSMGGTNVKIHISIPKPPIDVLIKPKHPITDDRASLKALPTTGTKLLEINLAVFILSPSVEAETIFWTENNPTNRVISKDKVKITVFFTADVKPDILNCPLIDPAIEKAKNTPINGSKTSAVIEEIICDNENSAVLYPIELNVPPEVAITPVKTGIKQSMKLPKLLIVPETMFIQPIIGVIIIPHVQTAVTIPKAPSSAKLVVFFKPSNNAQNNNIAKHPAKIEKGAFITSTIWEKSPLKNPPIEKFCISSGFGELTPDFLSESKTPFGKFDSSL